MKTVLYNANSTLDANLRIIASSGSTFPWCSEVGP